MPIYHFVRTGLKGEIILDDPFEEKDDEEAYWEASLTHPEGGFLLRDGVRLREVPNVSSEVIGH